MIVLEGCYIEILDYMKIISSSLITFEVYTVCLPSTKYLGWVIIFRSNIAVETPSDPPVS